MTRFVTLLVRGILMLPIAAATTIAGEVTPEQLVADYSDGHRWSGTSDEPIVSLREDHRLYLWGDLATIKNGMLMSSATRMVIQPDHSRIEVPVQFHIVPWGERIYLVKPEQMRGFIAEINLGVEPISRLSPRYGIPVHSAYLRKGDWEKKVEGDPALPKEYQKFLLPKAVNGKIIEIDGKGDAWVNVGSDTGLLPGMSLLLHYPVEFHPEHTGLRMLPVEVLAVEKERCLIAGTPEKMVGWKITSRRWD